MKDMGVTAIMPDLIEPVGPPADNGEKPPLTRRLMWMAVLALAGLIAVAGAAYILRALLLMN